MSLFDPDDFPWPADTSVMAGRSSEWIGVRCAEVEATHDRRTTRALELGFLIAASATYAPDLQEKTRQEMVARWERLSLDVELPAAAFRTIRDAVIGGPAAPAMIRQFVEDAVAHMEDQLLEHTDAARTRAGVWKMGCEASLAAVGAAQLGRDRRTELRIERARVHGAILQVAVPALPTFSGDRITDSAMSLHYILDTLGRGVAGDLNTLCGRRASALLEAAVKSTILVMLYSESDPMTQSLISIVERALRQAGIPSDLWVDLIAAVRDHRSFETVKSLVFRTHDTVDDYLAGLLVAARGQERAPDPAG
jgi:hypothetical protein